MANYGLIQGLGQGFSNASEILSQIQAMQEQRKRDEFNRRMSEAQSRLEEEYFRVKQDEIKDARRRWQAEQDERRRQFDLGYGLDKRGLAERSRQYDIGTGLSERELAEKGRQFDVGYGLDERKLAENARQFDLGTKAAANAGMYGPKDLANIRQRGIAEYMSGQPKPEKGADFEVPQTPGPGWLNYYTRQVLGQGYGQKIPGYSPSQYVPPPANLLFDQPIPPRPKPKAEAAPAPEGAGQDMPVVETWEQFLAWYNSDSGKANPNRDAIYQQAKVHFGAE